MLRPVRGGTSSSSPRKPFSWPCLCSDVGKLPETQRLPQSIGGRRESSLHFISFYFPTHTERGQAQESESSHAECLLWPALGEGEPLGYLDPHIDDALSSPQQPCITAIHPHFTGSKAKLLVPIPAPLNPLSLSRGPSCVVITGLKSCRQRIWGLQ